MEVFWYGSSRRPRVQVRALTSNEQRQIQAGLLSSDPFILRRCQVVMASSEGQSPEAIAKFVGFSVYEVVSLIHDFNQRGLAILDKAALPADPEIAPPALVPDTVPPEEKEPEAVRVSRLERVNAAFSIARGRVLAIWQYLIGIVLRVWLPLAGLIFGIWLAFRRWREPPAPEADAPALPRARPWCSRRRPQGPLSSVGSGGRRSVFLAT